MKPAEQMKAQVLRLIQAYENEYPDAETCIGRVVLDLLVPADLDTVSHMDWQTGQKYTVGDLQPHLLEAAREYAGRLRTRF